MSRQKIDFKKSRFWRNTTVTYILHNNVKYITVQKIL